MRAVATPQNRSMVDEEAFFTGARHAYDLLTAIEAGVVPPRALIIGSAGSGKSTVLRRLQTLLRTSDQTVTWLDDTVEPAAVPPDVVLVVDDLHLMPDEIILAVHRRARDGSALIAATRPWPRTEPLHTITRELEHTLPTIVAGHVVAADVAAYYAARGEAGPGACLDHLLELTGGITWLVSEALTIHASRPCDDPAHGWLAHRLGERIAQHVSEVDDGLRSAVERLVVGAAHGIGLAGDSAQHTADDLTVQGFSEGLLLRNGEAPPIVQATVRATIPLHRLITLTAGSADTFDAAALDHSRDPRVGQALATQADRLVDVDPIRAGDLYRRAAATGLTGPEIRMAQVRAAWAAGDLDHAAELLDATTPEDAGASGDGLADAAAAVWAARAMMSTASDVHVAFPPRSAADAGHAAVAHLGAGLPDRLARAQTDRPTAPPTTLGVGLGLLEEGLLGTLGDGDATTAVYTVVRASELYSAARSTLPIAELPAVVAAGAALGSGATTVARAVITAALAAGQGGIGMRRRLLLWRAWIAIASERPAEAREALALAEAESSALTPRDRFLDLAVRVVLVRRYESLAALETVWADARERVQQTEIDLFLMNPFATLVCASARLGDATTLAAQTARAGAMLERLGWPAVWSAHLHWAGIQQDILLNRPHDVAPHAHALVAASAHSDIAQTMAHAGRVWMSVLGGHVDPDAVEEAATALAEVGLAWDGARLAGHGSARCDDRKVAARLLACARRLHPHDALRQAAGTADGDAPAPVTDDPQVALSERELDVAHLVLQGKTYAEIGKAIFISPRTAEHHIARIRQRLGATSRSDLMARLRVLLEPGASTQADARAADRASS